MFEKIELVKGSSFAFYRPTKWFYILKEPKKPIEREDSSLYCPTCYNRIGYNQSTCGLCTQVITWKGGV